MDQLKKKRFEHRYATGTFYAAPFGLMITIRGSDGHTASLSLPKREIRELLDWLQEVQPKEENDVPLV